MGAQKIIKEENKERKQQGRSDDEPRTRGKVKTKRVPLKEIQNVQMKQQDCLKNKRVNANNKKVEAKKTTEVITSIQPSRAKKKQSSIRNSKAIPIFESKDAALEELRLIHSPQSKRTSFQDDGSNFIGDVNCSWIEVENKSQNTNQSIQHDQAIITKDEEQMSSTKGPNYNPRDQRKVPNLIMQYENGSPKSKFTSLQDDDSNFIDSIDCTGIGVEDTSRNTNQSIHHDQGLICRDEEQISSVKGPEYIPRDKRKVQNLIMQYENKVAAVGSVQRTLDPLMSSTSIQQDSLNCYNDETRLKEKDPQLRSSDNCSFFSGLTRLFTGGQKPQNCFTT